MRTDVDNRGTASGIRAASGWTAGEAAVLTAEVRLAPSVHNTQPWVLDFQDGTALLRERYNVPLPRHDPAGRDRMISCGAALANLLLAARVLGWDPEVELFADPARPDKVARIAPGQRRPPSIMDLARYASIRWRRSYRRPFAAAPLPSRLRRELVTAATCDGVQIRLVSGTAEVTALAGMLSHATLLLRGDHDYQRELAAWTSDRTETHPGGGISAHSLEFHAMPWAGLVRPTTPLTDVNILAARLDRETLVLVETPDDGPRDHLMAGIAMQQTWLAAASEGLAGSVLTQPLHLPEVRAGLIERLELAGFPQALMRFGYPA